MSHGLPARLRDCLIYLQANLADFSDNQWVTCFQESAEALLGCSADTLGQLRDTVGRRVDCSSADVESFFAVGYVCLSRLPS